MHNAAETNLGRAMAESGMSDYRRFHSWSVKERAAFWEMAIGKLGIVFARNGEKILDDTGGAENARWLPGCEMNITESCFRAGPDRAAILFHREGKSGVGRVTAGELEELAARFAGGLARHGLRPGDGVALYMPMNVECVAAYLGVIRAGCRVVSIPDSFSPDEAARRLEIGNALCVVTVASYLRGGRRIPLYEKVVAAGARKAVVVGTNGEKPTLREEDVPWEEFLAPPGSGAAVRPADAEEVTNILFSSGTTGTPKAIPWTHLTPIKCAMDGFFHHDIHAGDVVAWPTNIGWMMGPWLIYASLINGAAMALYEGAPTGEEFLRFVGDAGVTMLGVVPSLVRAWRAAPFPKDADWSALRLFSSTGEPSGKDDYRWLMDLPGRKTPVIEYCGGTEIGGGYITGTVVQESVPTEFTTAALGLDFVVLDGDGKPVLPGDSGEVFLIPPSIGLSTKLLNADHHEIYYAGCPPGPGGVMLRRHGDRILCLEGGRYRAEGRADDTMNLGGIKVSSLELERVLVEDPSIGECAAVSVRPGGGGPEKLVLFVVPAADGAKIDAGALRVRANRLLAERLNPLFHAAELIVVNELPRTASQKLMRRSLRDRAGNRPAR